MSVCLSVCLSVPSFASVNHVPICCLSIDVSLYVCLCVCLFLHLHQSIVCLFVVCLSLCLSTPLFASVKRVPICCLLIYLSVCLSTPLFVSVNRVLICHLSTYVYVCLSLCVSISSFASVNRVPIRHLSIYLSVSASVRPFIHISQSCAYLSFVYLPVCLHVCLSFTSVSHHVSIHLPQLPLIRLLPHSSNRSIELMSFSSIQTSEESTTNTVTSDYKLPSNSAKT